MFKVDLIQNSSYYKTRQWVLIISFVALIPLGIFSNFFQTPMYYWLPALLVFLALTLIQIRWQSRMKKQQGNRTLYWDNRELALHNNGEVETRIPNTEILQISIPQGVGIPGEKVKEMFSSKENYLIINTEGQELRFDFILDAHYMLVQLEKCLTSWEVMSGKERVIIA